MEERGMVILAQDPSFRKLSFSLYDGKRTVYLDSCSFSLGECIGFEKVFNANIDIFGQYKSKLEEIGVNRDFTIDKIFSEIPPPVGMFSAGLYSLDTFILYKLFEMNEKCSEVFTLPPSFLMTIHNTRKYNKSESTSLANYMISEVLSSKFDFVMSGKMNADRAESLLFLMRAFVKYNINGVADEIIGAISGFYSEPEKILISR